LKKLLASPAVNHPILSASRAMCLTPSARPPIDAVYQRVRELLLQAEAPRARWVVVWCSGSGAWID
jgi:hypothetical protein